ncbi:MAG: TIR domain-containing protein [Oscillospiraceae bacterium]
MSCKIFIGCSKEALSVAQAVQAELKNRSKDCLPIIWNQNVIRSGEYTIPELIRQLKDCQYAIWIFGKDDVTTSRGRRRPAARDNVVFEYGLAVGILGKKNSFIFKASGVVLPSDFKGMACSEYDNERVKENAVAEISNCVTDFENAIGFALHELCRKELASWEKYTDNVDTLCRKVGRSPRQGGFRFDAVVGISRGGIIAADLLNRKFMARAPLLCLWGDGYTLQPEVGFETPLTDVNAYVFSALEDEKYANILVVDDITRKGKTITGAVKLLKEKFPKKNIKSAVLFVPEGLKSKVDYYGESTSNPDLLMPYSVLD